VREPFKLQNGWLLWAGIGLVGAVVAVALLGFVTALLNGEPPQREVQTFYFYFEQFYLCTQMNMSCLFCQSRDISFTLLKH
jgi:hypothetical protein